MRRLIYALVVIGLVFNSTGIQVFASTLEHNLEGVEKATLKDRFYYEYEAARSLINEAQTRADLNCGEECGGSGSSYWTLVKEQSFSHTSSLPITISLGAGAKLIDKVTNIYGKVLGYIVLGTATVLNSNYTVTYSTATRYARAKIKHNAKFDGTWKCTAITKLEIVSDSGNTLIETTPEKSFATSCKLVAI
ncbi:hypothetical protein GMB34_09790 [Turicibacter sanguinis]|nr:hypothetical protein [Turicibacter sanguinis]MTN84198.1 hypothetical protein [Turicibacter sanguinis]MTN86890.1 hypothetical protein [Turicibacter sanguinis]MTN90005.1 hypothetical protein [Turicibacter sanguinis]MTN93071.1 hypothetical protein [Turicibacter sanguinis]